MTPGQEVWTGGVPVRRAGSPLERLRGLAWRRHAPPYALRIDRCRSIHTFGMRFALDVVWLDARGRAIRVDRGVRPGRIRSCRGARSVLELPAGLERKRAGGGYTAAR